jgi:cytochrome c biogenesis protein CcdA/thiol-disulfide isomerase/thioredoxin
MLAFLAISFVAGILTVLAPCILPLLPVIVGGAAEGGASWKRAAVIAFSLGASVFAFTLILKVSTAFITIPPLFWQILSGGLLILFGIATIVPGVWEEIPGINYLYRASNKMLGTGYKKKSLVGDAIIGAALGPVFSSCSPTYFVILAAVLPAHFAAGLLYLLAYVLGMSLFLFALAFAGQRIVAMLGVAADPKGWFKKIIGIVFILVGLAVILGLDKKLEYALPAGSYAEVGIEQGLLRGDTLGTGLKVSPQEASSSPMDVATSPMFLSMAQKALRYQKAPELVKPDGYFNTTHEPSLAEQRGHSVVLVDFWDYSCINCQRAQPYINAWYQKYKDQGLVVIGVHTPEFAFEHLLSNVHAAADKAGITYPVVLDNEYQTWGAFQNQYWPREYLIDIDGYIVHDHAGEGEYDVTEKAIQQALAERAERLNAATSIATSTVDVTPADLSGIQSPETYFGSSRNQYLGNGTPGKLGTQTFVLPQSPTGNTLYLGGAWNIQGEYAEAGDNATVEYYYSAKNIYMVAESPPSTSSGQASASVTITEDSSPSTTVTVTASTLYPLMSHPSAGPHLIRLSVPKGVRLYTLTFG